MTDFSAVILAGGKSSRMGSDKAGLTLNGKNFAEYISEKLFSMGADDIMLSGHEGIVPHVVNVPDEYSGKGPLAGIYSGLIRAKHSKVLILAVDSPLIPEEFIERLIEAHEGGITAASYNGRVEPLVAVADRDLSVICRELLDEDVRPVMRFFEKTGYKTVAFEGDELLIRGCNTRDDYLKLKQLHNDLF